jgi:xylose isomerase
MDGVWHSAAANMRTYLLLKKRAAAFRADPEVHDALEAARVHELSQPTLAPGESWSDIVANESIGAFDVDAAGAKGYGFVRLHQLAVEHLMGAR